VREKTHGNADAAAELGKSLPFLEHQLYRELVLKLRLRAFNSAFNLRVQVVMSTSLLVAIASCTGVHLAALEMPPEIRVWGELWKLFIFWSQLYSRPRFLVGLKVQWLNMHVIVY